MSDTSREWRGPVVDRPEADDVHVWTLDLRRFSTRADSLYRVLDDDERERATAFQIREVRRRFVLTRGLLRVILGRYLERAPETLRFEIGSHGKPALAEDADTESGAVSFNVSKTGELSLVAVAATAVGVDVERIREVEDVLGLVRRFLHNREAAMIEEADSDGRSAAFLALWTCKEAVVKALGRGMAVGLRDLAVALDPDGRARVVAAEGSVTDAFGCSLLRWEPAPGYTSALAVVSPQVPRPRFLTFPL